MLMVIITKSSMGIEFDKGTFFYRYFIHLPGTQVEITISPTGGCVGVAAWRRRAAAASPSSAAAALEPHVVVGGAGGGEDERRLTGQCERRDHMRRELHRAQTRLHELRQTVDELQESLQRQRKSLQPVGRIPVRPKVVLLRCLVGVVGCRYLHLSFTIDLWLFY